MQESSAWKPRERNGSGEQGRINHSSSWRVDYDNSFPDICPTSFLGTVVLGVKLAGVLMSCIGSKNWSLQQNENINPYKLRFKEKGIVYMGQNDILAIWAHFYLCFFTHL